VRLNVLHPVPDVVKRRLVCYVIHQQDAHGAAVVRCKASTKVTGPAPTYKDCGEQWFRTTAAASRPAGKGVLYLAAQSITLPDFDRFSAVDHRRTGIALRTLASAADTMIQGGTVAGN
jgi:hypothetical protein